MGYSSFYQAIPEDSKVLSMLRERRTTNYLLNRLFIAGSRPLDLWELDEEEYDEMLESMVDLQEDLPEDEFDRQAREEAERILGLGPGELLVNRHGPFASRAEVDDTFTELRAAVRGLTESNPGLIDRVAFLEKCHDEIEGPLSQALERSGCDEAPEFVRTLLYGDHRLAAEMYPRLENQQLRIVPASLVKKAAPMLRDLASDRLFARDEQDWLWESYLQWRELYLQAAERGEAVLVR